MTHFQRIAFLSMLIFIIPFLPKAQSVSINNTATPADASSMLDVSSTTKGILIPRMTKTNKLNILSPATGLMIYQTLPDSIGFHYFDGTRWNWVPNTGRLDSTSWQTKGNTGLVDSMSFLGNVDNVPVNFRVNNEKVGKLDRSRLNYSFGRGAGNDLSIGQISIGDSAGANINNNYAGIHIGYRSGVKNIGNNNTFVGSWTGENTTTGSVNTFLGTAAGQLNTTGFSNVYVGIFSGNNNKTGGGNSAVGVQALQGDSSGQLNVAVGYQAMSGSKSASENTALGSFALQNHKINPYNVAVGDYSMNQDTAGYSNVAVGTSSLRFNVNGNYNTALGTNAMINHKRNDFNTAVGYEVMVSDTSGYSNTAMGWRSLRYNLSGSENTAIGVGAMENDTLGFGNTAIGRFAIGFGSKGNYNAAVGYQSLFKADSSSLSVGIGVNAGYWNTRDNLVAVGYGALALNSYSQTDLTIGVENSALGYASAYNANTGSKNTSIGFRAMQGIGYFAPGFGLNNYKRNTAIGDSALVLNFGNDNTSVGYLSLSKNISGSQNTALGTRALANATPGYPNTAVGYSSMDSTTTGTANTAVGSYSLLSNKTGGANVAIGNAAMYLDVSGSNNTAVGNDALRLGSADLNTAIGYQAAYFNNRNNNTFIGSFAGICNSASTTNPAEGIENTGVGYRTLQANSRGNKNTALGYHALSLSYDNTYIISPVSDRNTAIGDSSQAFMFGFSNTSVGNATLSNIQSGFQNTAMGDSAMGNAMFAAINDAYGLNSLKSLKYTNYGPGYYNTALGGFAMENDTTAYATVAVGYSSLRNSKKVFETTAVGVNALGTGDSTSRSVAIGRGALFNFGHSYDNTAVGTWAMSNKLSGYYNTAVGLFAMELDNSGLSNTALGTSALRTNIRSAENVAVGINAGYYVTGDGSSNGRNTYVGPYAGMGQSNLSVGIQNTGIGYNALINNTSGNYNTSLGDNSLNNNTSGNLNVAIGKQAGGTNTTGANNTFVGNNTNVSSGALTNASAFGANALVNQSNSLVLGSINGVNGAAADTRVGIGTTSPNGKLHVSSGVSGGAYIAGSQIILEGNTTSYIQLSHPDLYETGILSSNSTILRSALIFGANNSMQLRTGGNLNRLYINAGGSTGINRTPTLGIDAGTLQVQNVNTGDDVLGLYNNVGNRWTYYLSPGGNSDLYFYYNGTIKGSWSNTTGSYTVSSDKRLKKDFTPFNYGLEAVKALKPYKYHYLDNKATDRLSVGFLAQDVLEVLPEAVYSNLTKDGKEVYSMDYQSFSVLSVKAIQEQQVIIDKQQKTIIELIARVEKLEKK